MESKRTKGLRILCVMVVLYCLAPGQSASAQTGTSLMVDPTASELWLNGPASSVVQIVVNDVTNLQAFDITLTYDPEVAELGAWAYGELLDPLALVKKVEEPGLLRIAAVQLAGEPASGDGVLLKLTFSGSNPGVSAVTIASSALSSNTGQPISHTRENGTLAVGYFFPVTGSISLQGQANRGGVPVILTNGVAFQAGPFSTTSLDQFGDNLNFSAVMADTYTVTTQQPRYLNLTDALAKQVAVEDGTNTISLLTLAAGNAVWTDNVIDTADASLVGASYGLTLSDLAPGEMLDADVNFDGVVNLRDLALIAGNYDLTSASAYESWAP